MKKEEIFLFGFCIFFTLSLSLSLSLTEDASQRSEDGKMDKEDGKISPRRRNLVSTFLNETLNDLCKNLSKGNITLGDITLGEDVGRLGGVVMAVPGGPRGAVDGVGSWGVKLDAGAEELALGGNYDFLYLDVPMLFPFFGKGNFSVSLEGITFNMTLNAKFDFTNDTFSFEIPRFKIVVTKSKVHFENLMNDLSLANFLNELISNLGPDLVEMLNEPLRTVLKSLADLYGNGIFLCIKNELATGGVKECIENLFKTPFNEKFFHLLKYQLIERYNEVNYS